MNKLTIFNRILNHGIKPIKNSKDNNYYDEEVEDAIVEKADEGSRKLYLENYEETGAYKESEITKICKEILLYNEQDSKMRLKRKERKPILLYIDTNGGDVSAGFKLIDVINISKTPIITVNMGRWESMGFLIGISGHQRYAMASSIFLLHDGDIEIYGSNCKAIDTIKFIEKHSKEIVRKNVIKNCGITENEYDEHRREEWYFLARDAKEKGIIDAIIGIDEKYDIDDIT